ncbi:hypothetical protein ACH5RR_023355 [Cinchona calisaya]|uniref:Uncharacterized protein n=1 Tax=Cinchona calisaya TaxID=153742 RepID=A0ABD2ZFF8_9GENT
MVKNRKTTGSEEAASSAPPLGPPLPKFHSSKFDEKLSRIGARVLNIFNFESLEEHYISALSEVESTQNKVNAEIGKFNFTRVLNKEDSEILVRELIANTHCIVGIIDTVRRRPMDFRKDMISAYYDLPTIENSKFTQFMAFYIDHKEVLRELTNPQIPEGVAKWEFYPNRECMQFK